MKRIKGVRKTTHKLIMKATQDYYMRDTNLNVAKYLFGERIELDNQQKHDVFCIRANLTDQIYLKELS
jgi:hypothetical protein